MKIVLSDVFECLQDEGVRLRKVASATPSYQSSSSPLQQSSSMTLSPLSVDASAFAAQPPVVYLIAMLILGVIIGKFLL